MSLETAYNKLAGKWQGYFERSRDNGDHGDSGAMPMPGQGKRRSLFQKLQQPSRPQARRSPLCITDSVLLQRPMGDTSSCRLLKKNTSEAPLKQEMIDAAVQRCLCAMLLLS